MRNVNKIVESSNQIHAYVILRQAFMSMFQIFHQEGWSAVTNATMSAVSSKFVTFVAVMFAILHFFMIMVSGKCATVVVASLQHLSAYHAAAVRNVIYRMPHGRKLSLFNTTLHDSLSSSVTLLYLNELRTFISLFQRVQRPTRCAAKLECSRSAANGSFLLTLSFVERSLFSIEFN